MKQRFYCVIISLFFFLHTLNASNGVDCGVSDVFLDVDQTYCDSQHVKTLNKRSVSEQSDMKPKEGTSECKGYDQEFECFAIGRFPNLNDFNCRRYYLCSLLNNGSFVRKEYICPNTSTFYPPSKKCSTSYVCPCSSLLPVETSTSVSTTPSNTVLDGLTTTSLLTTPAFGCTSSISSYKCSYVGRYSDNTDLHCQKYYLCSKLHNGTFIQTPYSCPPSSVFHQPINRCSTNYACPCTIQTTSSPTASDTSAPDSEFPIMTSTPKVDITTVSTPSLPISTLPNLPTTPKSGCVSNTLPFTCKEAGRFGDLGDPTCRNYYLCSLLRNGTFVKKDFACPPTTTFNPTTGKCSITYVCPCSSTSTNTQGLITTTSTSAETIAENLTTTTDISQAPDVTVPTTTSSNLPSGCGDPAADYSCSAVGRFPYLGDPNCRMYYLCSLLRNGTFVKKDFECPPATTFNPTTGKCSTSSYVCPCSSTSTTTKPSETPKTDLISSTVDSIFTTKATSKAPETTILPSTIPSPFPSGCITPYSEFQCSEVGRFPDLSDFTCQKYFLCSKLHNGTFVHKQYACPSTSTFHPPSKKCSSTYPCPCSQPQINLTPSGIEM